MSVRATLRQFIRQWPYIRRLHERIEQQGEFAAGHYYSPIPARAEVDALLHRHNSVQEELHGIDLNTEAQLQLLQEYQSYYDELPFTEEPTPALRYYYNQPWFCYADAIFLYSFLRHFQPRRIVEIGSGFSSAVMLDVVERFFTKPPQITLIDPETERLMKLLKPEDRQRARIIAGTAQGTPIELFTELRQNDLLFIDSSHVLKFGSDLQFLLFKILPRIKPGVTVHFHDIFYPFEYPAEWLNRGRFWNEAYALRAFLMHNNAWDILFFNNYIGQTYQEHIARTMPLCTKNIGGSLYLRRKDYQA